MPTGVGFTGQESTDLGPHYQAMAEFQAGRVCKIESEVEGRSSAVVRKQVVHGIADAVAQIVTDDAHTVEADHERVALGCR